MSLSKIVAGFALASFAAVAAAQERPPYGPDVTLEQAKKIAAGAAAESQKNGWRMAIAGLAGRIGTIAAEISTAQRRGPECSRCTTTQATRA